MLVVFSDPQHGGLSLRIVHLIRENASLFCAGAPVFGIVNMASHSPSPICCNFVTPEQEIRPALGEKICGALQKSHRLDGEKSTRPIEKGRPAPAAPARTPSQAKSFDHLAKNCLHVCLCKRSQGLCAN